MSVQAVSGEIAVVGLVIHADGKVAVRIDEIAQVEVSDETLGGIGVVAIAKLTIEEQPVVQQPSAQDTLIFRIVESFITRRDIGSEVPVVTLYYIRQHRVDLLRDGSTQETLHRQRSLTLLGGILTSLVVVGLCVEAADGKQIEHLLVHLFLRIDDGVNHLLGICIHCRQVHREIYLRTLRRARDVHQTVYSDIVG